MKPLSEVAPLLLVIHVQNQAVCVVDILNFEIQKEGLKLILPHGTGIRSFLANSRGLLYIELKQLMLKANFPVEATFYFLCHRFFLH